MKVAIIGSGISGLMVAEQLDHLCDYTVFEQSPTLGGHTDTHEIEIEGKTYNVDTGFIVCNRKVYKHFFTMLDKYGIKTQKSDMSFAVNNLSSGLVYNATSIPTLFCQKKNMFNPKFYRMIYDINRFYKAAEKLLVSDSSLSLGEYLEQNNYSQYFIKEHILPMASALWSGDFDTVKRFPLVYMLSFMKNHQMLQLDKRPTWETIVGGSNQYVKTLSEKLKGEFLCNAKVNQVTRLKDKVIVQTEESSREFDYVFFSSHSDQTLKLIDQPSTSENDILSNIGYTKNTVDLHTDSSIMPKNKKAWASWVVNKYPDSKNVKDQCTVNYYMNLLQNINCPKPLIVSLNQSEHIRKEYKLKTVYYQHPVYTNKTIEAQSKKDLIQGKNNSYFCGAYWGWGFHEDGARSAVEAVNEFKAQVLLK